MDTSREHVVSVVLNEEEWRAFVRLHPQPVRWLRDQILEAVARSRHAEAAARPEVARPVAAV
jgi:hypothetical protein